jgi:alkylation response protein AidB-like acyl-CoA dehydrogenase
VDFALNQDQLDLKAEMRRFAREVIRPVAAKHDAEESTPWEVMKEARARGLHGLDNLQRMGQESPSRSQGQASQQQALPPPAHPTRSPVGFPSASASVTRSSSAPTP